MNLLDTASLVVTPNGYKASKLYSIIPSDGTGDMTFARTGDTATRVNSSGLIETVLANKPRLDYLGSTCPKLLLEPQRTNVLTHSEQINSWSGDATINSNVSISPSGVQNADEAIFNSTYRLLGCSITSGTSYSASIFYKNNNYTNSDYFTFLVSDGVVGPMSVRIYPSTNTFSNVVGWVGASASIESYGNGWYRAIIKATANQTGSGWFEVSGSSNKSVYLWGAQLEVGAYATSYIPTTTASVTRNADSASKTGISSLIGQTEGTLFVNANISNFSEARRGIVLSADANNFITLRISSGNDLQFLVFGSGAIQANFTIANPQGNVKMALAYKANDFAAYLNGTLVGTDTSGTVPATSGFYLGYDPSGTNQLAGGVNQAILFKTRLSNAVLATLTTL